MSTRDLIDAIVAGDAVATQNAFNAEIASRVSDRLDVARTEVAQTMFRPEPTIATEANESYSAKEAHAGKDIGKPGKNFRKIEKDAAGRYGSEAAGKRVAGFVLKKLREEKTGNSVYTHEIVAQKVHDEHPNLKSEDEILDHAHRHLVKMNLKNALRHDDDLAGDIVTHYAMLQRGVKEETTLGESLGDSATIEDWIQDFSKSDKPQFAGKTQNERRKMALAAFYSRQKPKKNK